MNSKSVGVKQKLEGAKMIRVTVKDFDSANSLGNLLRSSYEELNLESQRLFFRNSKFVIADLESEDGKVKNSIMIPKALIKDIKEFIKALE